MSALGVLAYREDMDDDVREGGAIRGCLVIMAIYGVIANSVLVWWLLS